MAEAELTTIARPYARAAFSYALSESDGLAKWSRMLALLGAAVAADVVRRALENPRLTTVQEAKLLTDIVADDLDDAGRNFVSILADHGRLASLPRISELYEQFKAQYEKTLDVDLTSAFEVDPADEDKLAQALKRRLQKEVKITTRVDRGLLGGVIIRTEDTVIDNSVRGKLEKLSLALS
ncbi:MAG: F0F1 ATP synthase subunit delta [Pseudomonadales bacterium]